MFDLERSSDLVVRVGIQTEVERRSVAFGTIVIVRSQDFNHLPRWHVLRQNRPVVLQIIIDIFTVVLYY